MGSQSQLSFLYDVAAAKTLCMKRLKDLNWLLQLLFNVFNL